ncbi:MAG: DUF4423 domain-containing protein [Bacteriovoracaceae bacterium]
MNNTELFKFLDYRDFLRQHIEDKKKAAPQWSLAVWSRSLGLSSTSSLTKVLNGEREPGEKITHSLVSYFKFDHKEEIYFKDFVRLSKIKSDPRLKSVLIKEMGKLSPSEMIRLLDDKTFSIIKDWYCLAIREMLRLKDFQENPQWIAKRLAFSVSEEQIKKTLHILLQQGMIVRDAEGKLQIGEGSLQTRNDKVSEAIQSYHTQMLEKAKEALLTQHILEREFTAETITINQSQIPEAKELIRKFKADFARLFEEAQGDQTYQMQIQFFSLTKEISNEILS